MRARLLFVFLIGFLISIPCISFAKSCKNITLPENTKRNDGFIYEYECHANEFVVIKKISRGTSNETCDYQVRDQKMIVRARFKDASCDLQVSKGPEGRLRFYFRLATNFGTELNVPKHEGVYLPLQICEALNFPSGALIDCTAELVDKMRIRDLLQRIHTEKDWNSSLYRNLAVSLWFWDRLALFSFHVTLAEIIHPEVYHSLLSHQHRLDRILKYRIEHIQDIPAP